MIKNQQSNNSLFIEIDLSGIDVNNNYLQSKLYVIGKCDENGNVFDKSNNTKYDEIKVDIAIWDDVTGWQNEFDKNSNDFGITIYFNASQYDNTNNYHFLIQSTTELIFDESNPNNSA